MKICFFTAALTKGGAERVISNLSNFLVNHKEIEKVDIITILIVIYLMLLIKE